MDNALKITDVYDLDEQNGQFKRLLTVRNKCKRAFLSEYPGAFFDPGYVKEMRSPLAVAYRAWVADLNKQVMAAHLGQGEYDVIVNKALAIVAGTNLLTAAEQLQLASAVNTTGGARLFATGLYECLYSHGSEEERFEHFSQVCARLVPVDGKACDLLTWQMVTVFGAIAQPRRHVFIKPVVTRQAAIKYAFPFDYKPEPNWNTYSSMLDFAACLRADLSDLRPRDLLDLSVFIGLVGSADCLPQ